MEPRFIAKTHTGALRPGNYSVLIRCCTYSDQSSYPETVARRLESVLGENKKAIAKYIVLTAGTKNRGFQFVFDNMTWSWKGNVINAILTSLNKTNEENVNSFYDLTKLERLAYLRFYLETEGAFILKIASLLKEKGQVTYGFLADNIEEILRTIYEEYIDAAADFSTRRRIQASLKEMQKQIKSETGDYAKDTKPHKVVSHLEAMEDLGLIVADEKNHEVVYESAIVNNVEVLRQLSLRLQTIPEMEHVFVTDGYFDVIATALNLTPTRYTRSLHCETLKNRLITGYRIMKNKATGIADIEAITDWCCITMLSDDNLLVTKRDIQTFLDDLRKEKPGSIGYHVDGKGNISYLIISGLDEY